MRDASVFTFPFDMVLFRFFQSFLCRTGQIDDLPAEYAADGSAKNPFFLFRRELVVGP